MEVGTPFRLWSPTSYSKGGSGVSRIAGLPDAGPHRRGPRSALKTRPCGAFWLSAFLGGYVANSCCNDMGEGAVGGSTTRIYTVLYLLCFPLSGPVSRVHLPLVLPVTPRPPCGTVFGLFYFSPFPGVCAVGGFRISQPSCSSRTW